MHVCLLVGWGRKPPSYRNLECNMLKTAIMELISELESLRLLTTNPDKKEAFTISIGLAKLKLDLEQQQITDAFDQNVFIMSASEYYNTTYKNGI